MFKTNRPEIYFKNCEIIKTTGSTIIKTDNCKFTNHYTNDYKKLSLMSAYKKQVIKNFDLLYLEKHTKIIKNDYFFVNFDNLYNSVTEEKEVYIYDLNKAYLNALLELKLIDKNIYSKIKEYYSSDKEKVMQIIGSIATKRRRENIVNGERIQINPDNYDLNEKGAIIWSLIEKQISDKINFLKQANENNFIYFWVDEICFNKIINFDRKILKCGAAVIRKNGMIEYNSGKKKDFSFLFKKLNNN